MNNFAISSGGIGEALTRSASALNSANNTIDESIALITSANAVVQNPEIVGTAYKTIALRIRGAKSELEDAGLETDGLIESTSKLRDEVLALSGVDILEADGQTFKSTYQILDEISQVYDDLSDVSQANLLEIFAGKRQSNILAATLSNFDTARDALETSLNSSGSALKEHEKWQKSLEAQTLKLESAWQSLSQTFMSSKFLHGALEAVIGLVDGIEGLIDTIGVIPTLVTAFTAFQSFKGQGLFRVIEDEAAASGKRISTIFGTTASSVAKQFNAMSVKTNPDFRNSLNQDCQALSRYRLALSQGMSTGDAFNKHLTTASQAAQNYAKSGQLAAKGITVFANQQKAAQVTMVAQNNNFSSAKALMNEYNSGCKNTAMAQTDFVNAVKAGNSGLGNYLSGLNGAKATMRGYIGSLVATKAATFALQVATMALNAAITMGISFAIQGLITLIDKAITTEEELAEKVEEVTTKFKEQHTELQKLRGDYDTGSESSMISKYEKLSKGVDHLGRNVSLTADEYSEYQSIVDRIAEQFPTLIKGYDETGSALLSCKDDVEQLTAAYENLIKTNNNAVLDNAGDIGQSFADKVKENENTDIWTGDRMTEGGIKVLESALGKTWTAEELEKYLDGYEFMVQAAFAKAGIGDFKNEHWITNDFYDDVKYALQHNPNEIKGIIDSFKSGLEEDAAEMKAIAQAALSNALDISDSEYYDISDSAKSIVKNIVNSWDYEFYKQYKDNPLGIATHINDTLAELKSISDEDTATIEAAFDLQTQFNGGEISYGEYVKGLENTGKLIDRLDLDPELESQLKLSIGLDEDGLVAEYHQLRNRLASDEYFDIMPSGYESFIEGLSAEELSVLWSIIPELEQSDYKETLADIKAALEKEMMLQGLTFDLNLEVEATGLEALNTALAESVSATGLSSESINALKGRYADLEAQGFDLSVMFEETSHGVRLNRQEFNKLEKAYATQKLDEVNGDLEEMQNAYDQLGEDIKNCTDPVEKAKLFSDRQLLATRISEAATLAAQYQGLTSAYNDWLAAEEAGQERGMYENVISGFETIDDEISRGWIDDGTIEFLELLTGRTDLAGKSGKQLKEIYDGLDKTIGNSGYSIRDFFTVNEDGESTNTGVYNFLETVESFEDKLGDVINRDGDGNIIGFDFEVAGGDEVIAETLGISEELVQIMLRAADDAGFVVTMDGTYKQLADLQNEARAAANYLKEIGKTDVDFDFNTTSVENLKSQLEDAHKILDDKDFWNKDGTFNFDADGATEAMQVVSALQAKLDKLTEEQYGIGLTVEDEQFEEPLENLQEYGRTVQTLNQLKLNPKANAEEIKELEGDLKEIAEYFANLDGETKVKLGLDADDNWEEVKKKIENGEVKIPTVLDIQANMDKNIETLADLALLNSGLLSEDEEKVIRQKYTIKPEVEVEDEDVEEAGDEVKRRIGGGKFKSKSSRKTNIQIVAETTGVEDVDDLTSKLKGLDDKTVQAIADVIGQIDVDKLKQTIAMLEPKRVEAIVEAIGKGDVDGLKSAINQLSPKQVQAIAEALGYSDVNELNTAIEGMDGNVVEAVANALGIDDVNSLQSVIDNMQGNTVDAKVNTDGQIDKVNAVQSSIDGLHGKTVNIVVNTIKRAITTGAKAGAKALKNRFGIGEADGTANANGTTSRAFKQGSWGTKNSGTALVGELGAETLVRDGRYYTIGDTGAEFIKYKKGDIIFNHRQTEELFANGKVTASGGRGKSFVEGTAFSKGSGGIGKVVGNAVRAEVKKVTDKVAKKVAKDTVKEVGKRSANEKPKRSGSNATTGGTGKVEGSAAGTQDKFEETFDWIAVAIERIEREIDNLDKTVGNVYKSWGDRNKALESEITKVGEEITLQEDAAAKYLAEANSIEGLSADYITKIQNGTLNLEDFEGETDEALVEKIKEYQKWYELYLQCIDAAEDLKQTEAELNAQRFENVQAQYDGILQGFEHTESMLNEYIAQAEAKGHIVSKEYYQALIDNEQSNIAALEKEQAELIAKRDEAVASGSITEGSQAWYDMCAEIDGVTQAIEEGNTSLIEYANSMRDIDWEVFDLMQERIADVTEEANFLIDLMSYDKLFDDNGKLTDKGMATMGLHGQNYNTYMYAADEYANEIAKIDKQIADGELDGNSQDVINRRRELIELQRESILAAEDEKQAIVDLVEEGINLELEALQERIDLHNEELDSMKDLYDYQKNVQKQTEEIASLEKQRAAYLNDTSEESKAKLQEITVSLKDAKENLQATEYDKYISDQSAMLDSLYDEYELILNQRLDNVDLLISQVIDAVNVAAGAEGTIATALGSEGVIAGMLSNNTTTIKSTLETEAKNVGATLSTAMKGIWSVDEGNAKSVLTTYGQGFQDKQTTTNTVLGDIKAYIGRMVDDVDKDATTKVNENKTTTSAKKDPTTNKSTSHTTTKTDTTNKSSGGDGTPKIGDKVKFLSGKYYYDSQGKSPAGSKNHGKQVYITNVNKRSWATHPYHISTGKKLGSGDLGWLKLNQISGYATGKKNFSNNEIAWTQENGQEFIVRPSDGAILTPIAKGDSVLTSAASNNIWQMANAPTEFIKNNLGLDSANVPNNSTVQSNYTQYLDKVVFNLPNVKNYDELLSAMQKDKNFERLVLSMTIDQIAGKSSLGKGKSIR